METSIMKADIFFFVTTVCVGLVSIGVVVALFYIVRILRDVKALSKKAKDEGEKILEDVRIIREEAEDKAVSWGNFLTTILGVVIDKRRRIKKSKSEDK